MEAAKTLKAVQITKEEIYYILNTKIDTYINNDEFCVNGISYYFNFLVFNFYQYNIFWLLVG